MKDLHELSIKIYGYDWYLTILPFSWYLWYKYRVSDRGDQNLYELEFLCFQLHWFCFSKRGMEGKRYRKELKRQLREKEKREKFLIKNGAL